MKTIYALGSMISALCLGWHHHGMNESASSADSKSAELTAQIQDSRTLLDADMRRNLESKFAEFGKRYSEVYAAAHEAEVGPTANRQLITGFCTSSEWMKFRLLMELRLESGAFERDAMHAGPRARAWRDPLTSFGLELVRGVDGEIPVVPVDSELGDLAHRLSLSSAARRALVALYSLYLVGEPALSISRLVHALADWTEPLGQGDLAALAMVRRHGGKVALRGVVTHLLDGLAPRTIRFVGGAATAPRPGITRLVRDGKSDATIETELATQLGRIAVIDGAASRGILEARLHGATALVLAPPRERPQPWPRDAGLIVVADADAPPWVAALAPTAS